MMQLPHSSLSIWKSFKMTFIANCCSVCVSAMHFSITFHFALMKVIAKPHIKRRHFNLIVFIYMKGFPRTHHLFLRNYYIYCGDEMMRWWLAWPAVAITCAARCVACYCHYNRYYYYYYYLMMHHDATTMRGYCAHLFAYELRNLNVICYFESLYCRFWFLRLIFCINNFILLKT